MFCSKGKVACLPQETALCAADTYCPSGSSFPALCPSGSYARDYECVACPAGFYSNPSSSGVCLPCSPGFVCLGASTRADPYNVAVEKGFPCPKGYYCPEGSFNATACPEGTYNNAVGAGALERCLSCPSGHYTDKLGQSKCKPCGPNATAKEGSTTCTCVGKYRAYQKYDGSCRCISTYEFRTNFKEYREADSEEDCFPIVYPRCNLGYDWDVNGDCAADDDCEAECAGLSGVKISGVGLCQCDAVGLVDDICDSACRAEKPSVMLRSDGTYLVKNPYTNLTQEVDMTVGYGYHSSVSCSSLVCPVYSTEMTSIGPQATFGVNSAMLMHYKVPEEYQDYVTTDTSALNSTSQSRRLQAASNGVLNPIVCMATGSTMMFSVSRSNYPRYSKDSLINTNQQFDYSAFKELDWLFTAGSSNFTGFAFTFSEPGIYDFVSSVSADMHIIIVVKGSDEACEDPGVLPRTATSLASLGVRQSENLIEDPEWGLTALLNVMSVILLSLGIICCTCTSNYYLATDEERLKIKERLAAACSRVFCKSRRRQVQFDLSYEQSSEFTVLKMRDEDTIDSTLFKKMLKKLQEHQQLIEGSLKDKSEEQSDEFYVLLKRLLKLRQFLRDELGSIDPALLDRLVVTDIADDMSEASQEQRPQTMEDQLERKLSHKLSMIVDVYTTDQEDRSEASREAVRRSILDNLDLTYPDKTQLQEDFDAAMQRIEDGVNADSAKAQQDLQQRLLERKARRQKAALLQEKVDKEQQALLQRHRQEQQELKEEKAELLSEIDRDFAIDRDRVKKEIRAGIDRHLERMRAQLQRDLAEAKSKAETDTLMRSHEIEAKRMENQLTSAKARQEQQMLKDLEDHRKQRTAAVQGDYERKIGEAKTRQAKEIKELASGKAQLAIWQLDLSKVVEVGIDERKAEDIMSFQKDELEVLKERHEEQLVELKAQLASERLEESLGSEIKTLKRAQQFCLNERERQRLKASMESLYLTQQTLNRTQNKDLIQRLQERRKRRAVQDLRKRQDEEAARLQLDHEAEADAVRVEEEQNQMIETIRANTQLTPQELMVFVRKLLSNKHDREVTELTARKHARHNDQLNMMLMSALNSKTEEIADIRILYRQQVDNLKGRIKHRTEHLRQLEVFMTQLNDALARADFRYISEFEEAQNLFLRELEGEFRQKFLDLVDQHMKETSELFRRVKNKDIALTEAHILDLRAEVDLEKTQIERRYFEKLKELDEQRKELRWRQRTHLNETNDFDREAAAIEAEQRHLEEIREKRQEMFLKQEQALRELRMRGVSPAEIEAIIKQHEIEVGNWEKAMEAERIRQKQMLQAKLTERQEQYKQRLQEQIAQYRAANLEVIRRQQEEEDQRKLRAVNFIDLEPALFCPYQEVKTRLKVKSAEVIEVDEDVLKELLEKVKTVEKTVKNVDSKQFKGLMTAAKELDRLIRRVKAKLR
jgi:hypothetical protein